MSRTIDHAPAADVAPNRSDMLSASPVTRMPRRRRFGSSEAATERLWLQEGFEPPAPDLEDFLAQAPPASLCNTHRIAIALFISMIALASVLKVDIIVAATGRLAADSPTIVLQPMQLSVIRQIKVRAGEVVRKGDILASLDPTFTQADRAALLAQQSAIRAQQARLEAELDGNPFDEERREPEFVLQQTLHHQRLAQFATRMADFDQKLIGYDVELTLAEQTQVSFTQQLTLSREVEGMRNSLYRSQSGSKLAYLEAQATRMRNERELQAAVTHLNALQQESRSLKAERQTFVDSWRRDLLELLVKTRAEARVVDESLTKANRMNELVVLAAPEDGVVLEVAKRSVGSVLNAAEPLITMIPGNADLIAEIAIGSADVGYAKINDVVALKVDAFPYQRHGLLVGRLRSIGADSFSTNAAVGGSSVFHHGQVEVTSQALKAMPEGARLIPGMTVTAEIKVGTRSIISYLTYPITRGINESIREP